MGRLVTGLNGCDQRRWEVREPLREMAQAIREGAMSEEDREWWRQHRIREEARRRLGVPDDEPHA